jgi:uncharacterized protein
MKSTLTNTIRQSFMQTSVPAKLVMVVFLSLLFLVIGMVVALLLAIPLFGLDIKTIYMIIAYSDADHIGILKYFQVVQSISLFLVPALTASWLFSNNGSRFLYTNAKFSVYTLILVFMALVMSIPFMNYITLWNSGIDLPSWLDGLENNIKSLEENAARLTELFIQSNSLWDLAVNFFIIAILPAISEEFMFRGVLQRLFIDWSKNTHAGVIIAAFLFSFIHFQFYGFIPRFLLGLYFGYLLVWSSSIWVPVTGHLINNGIAVIYYHFASKPVGDTALDTIGTGRESNYLLYLSVFLTSVTIGLIYLHEKKNKSLIG